MRVDVLNIENFIKENNCKEVTNPVHFNLGNMPTEDGLFSYTIFGQPGSVERRNTFAYISLKKRFLHPIVYKMVTSMDKKFVELINGTKFYRIERGQLVEDRENGQTGITFLYDNFENINFKETDSIGRSTKLTLLNKLKKDEAFIDKIIVIPAHLRDFNPSKASNETISAIDEINELYTKVIRTASSLDNSGGFDFMGSNAEAQIQNTIVDIYTMLTGFLAKKTGLFHQSLLGKSVDYATRSVISAPRLKTDRWDDNPVRYGYTGVPLAQVCVLFYPFFVKYITDFFEERIEEISNFKDEKGNQINIKNVREQFSEDKIKKLIELYIKSTESRFNSIKVKDDSGNYHPINILKDDLGRNFTVIDLLYIAATDIVEDKHVYITRYPVESYRM